MAYQIKSDTIPEPLRSVNRITSHNLFSSQKSDSVCNFDRYLSQRFNRFPRTRAALAKSVIRLTGNLVTSSSLKGSPVSDRVAPHRLFGSPKEHRAQAQRLREGSKEES